MIYQGEAATYAKFDSSVEGVTPVEGGIYTLTINKDGETIDGLVAVADMRSTNIYDVKQADQSFKLGTTATALKLATTVDPTIVKKDGGSWTVGSFSDLQDAQAAGTTAGKVVNWSYLDGSTNYVDTIVITGTEVNTAFLTAQTAIDTYIASNPSFTTLYGAASVANATANTVSAVQTEIGQTAKIPTTVAADTGLTAIGVTASDVTVTVASDGFTAAVASASNGSFSYAVTISKNGYTATLEKADGVIAQ